jgi:hypothetical protein
MATVRNYAIPRRLAPPGQKKPVREGPARERREIMKTKIEQAAEAREYLAAAAATETGREALRRLGYDAIIAAPRQGDDSSTIAVATVVRGEFRRCYGF